MQRDESGRRPIRKWPAGIPALLGLGLLSEAIYLWLARFDAQNGSPVFWFLLAFLLLFAIYALAAAAFASPAPQAPRPVPDVPGPRDVLPKSNPEIEPVRAAIVRLQTDPTTTFLRNPTPCLRSHERSSERPAKPNSEQQPQPSSPKPQAPGPKPQARLLFLIAAFGLLFRLTLVPAGLRNDLPMAAALWDDLRGSAVSYEPFLLYDQDVWRYLWEGHVWASGFDPFQHAPEDAVLDAVTQGPLEETWEEIRHRVSYPELGSIYPPLAQFLFRLSHATFPGSVAGLKLWLIALEVAAGWVLFLAARRLGVRPDLTLFLFFWNPLAVKAFSGSAHFDALVVLALALTAWAVAAGRSSLAQASLAAATLAKLVPGMLAALISPWRWRGALLAGLVLIIGVFPFRNGMGSRFLDTGAAFAADWRFNSAPYSLLEWLAGGFALPLYLVFLAALAVWIRRRAGGAPCRQLKGMLWLLGLAIVMAPVVHPWYVTWLLPMACLLRDRVWLSFSGLVFLAFFVMFDGLERQWVVAIEYIILGALILIDPFWRRRVPCDTSRAS